MEKQEAEESLNKLRERTKEKIKEPKDHQFPLRLDDTMWDLLTEVSEGLRRSKQDICRMILVGELLMIKQEAERLGSYYMISNGIFQTSHSSEQGRSF